MFLTSQGESNRHRNGPASWFLDSLFLQDCRPSCASVAKPGGRGGRGSCRAVAEPARVQKNRANHSTASEAWAASATALPTLGFLQRIQGNLIP